MYENPGLRRKIFYPNRQNSTLCPVKILEEEKAMRPSDADSCPSFLFLCIKYGGRTRNIPQNEYASVGRTYGNREAYFDLSFKIFQQFPKILHFLLYCLHFF